MKNLIKQNSNRILVKKISVLLLCVFVSTQCTVVDEKINHSEFNQLIKAANQMVGFNGSVLVGNSEKILYFKQIGFADKHKNTPLTEKHLFSTGSIGKEFSTLAIMKLVEDEKLNYQDKVSKYVTSLPNWSKEITIENIMTHTSGLPSLNWFIGIESEDVNAQINAVKELAFPSGNGFLYTNMNIVIRSYVVEAITGMPFQDFVTQEILRKANMPTAIQPIGMNTLTNQITYHEDPNALKAISYYATPLDLYNFEKSLWNDKIIKSNSLKEVLSGDKHSGSSNRAYFDFGRFYLNNDGEISYWEHDGSSWPTHHAIKYHNFEDDIFIILMSNDSNKNTLFELKTAILKLLETRVVAMPLIWQFKQEYANKEGSKAIANLKRQVQQSQDVEALESELNTIGYWLFQQEKYLDAKSVFKLNLELFPKSANAHDSYADVLIKIKDYEQAENILINGFKLAKKENNTNLINSITGQLKKIEQLVK
ncbi:serine hydrolase [Polaribacter sp.]|uniref:serine hydrolase n=1 Tax=Polaribacter sp. TaxID=1920175 RepID=UPI003F6A5C08